MPNAGIFPDIVTLCTILLDIMQPDARQQHLSLSDDEDRGEKPGAQAVNDRNGNCMALAAEAGTRARCPGSRLVILAESLICIDFLEIYVALFHILMHCAMMSLVCEDQSQRRLGAFHVALPSCFQYSSSL